MSQELYNDPSKCVDEFLEGMVSAYSGLTHLPGHRVILRSDLPKLKGKVGLISGGGSGHEPAFAGFVGRGMLTAAVSGSIFTSPPPSTILAAIRAVNSFGTSGIILIVFNYTGDRINFGLAKEWAQQEGISVSMVIIGEDCALVSHDRSAGRRGLAGGILLQKLAGAMSEEGTTVLEIESTLNLVCESIGTIGICTKPCILPGFTSPSFELDVGKFEIGLGVHGEAGVGKIDKCTSHEVVKKMLNHMTDKNSKSHLPLKSGDSVVLLLNNLGATSRLEMGIIMRDTIDELQRRGLNVLRVYNGSFMTSLQMAGLSITVLNLSPLNKEVFLRYLDAESNVVAPLLCSRLPSDCEPLIIKSVHEDVPTLTGPYMNLKVAKEVYRSLKSTCKAIIESEDILNTYDRGSGDGDCGQTHSRGASAIINESSISEEVCQNPAQLLQLLGSICHNNMGGTSGAMYGILFATMAKFISKQNDINISTIGRALLEGVETVKKCGGAKLGDRTMIDVLEPLSRYMTAFDNNDGVFKECIPDYVKGLAEKTRAMKAFAGRASYVADNLLTDPDPGAFAVAVAVEAFVK